MATVSINNSTNAALLAARILGCSDVAIRQRVEKYTRDSEDEVMAKDAKLDEMGWKSYREKVLKK